MQGKGKKKLKESREADSVLSEEAGGGGVWSQATCVGFSLACPPPCAEMSGMSLELGDRLSEMLLCSALATQLLIYSLVTLVCIGPPRVREHSLVRETDPQIQGHR